RRAFGVPCHVGRWRDCDRLVDVVYSRFGRCDVLVNNAGLSPAYDDLESVSEELYDKVQAVNAAGPFRLSTRIGARMAREEGGSIINVSSVASLRPTPADLPYAMAKAALNALTLGLAGAWSPKVRANAVLPSAAETDMTRAWPAEAKSRIAESNPMKRLGRPQDVADVCVFLASDAAGYLNGARIPVDGGLHRSL
ncbi:MAG TPA: SDR family oxidoreductase, partial [Acidimicrobiales bacterium]|nr:SDR family oxidoreductase [Acidimicrobiales bacterium]